MSEQILIAVLGFIKNLLLLFVAGQLDAIDGSDNIDFDELVEIAERYDCPQPNESDKLVVGWDGYSRSNGPLNSQQAGVYRPAFLTKKISDNESEVLMGFVTITRKSRKGIPSTRDFILSSPDETDNSYTISYGHLSSFETCIQLARVGNRELANQLWRQFSESRYIDGGHAQESLRELVANPKLLLARSIFEYNQEKTLQPDSDWQGILHKLETLRVEFPELFSNVREDYDEYFRNQFIDDLKYTVDAVEPTPNTVEDSLLQWAKLASQTRGLGFYSSHNLTTDAPARDIFERGIESITSLVDHVDDRRLTVHEQQAIMKARKYRLRVGDLARILLIEMAGANSPVGDRPFTQNPYRMQPNPWQDWVASTDFSNEAAFFEKAAFDSTSGKAYPVPIRILAVRHPKTFVKLVETVAENAKPATRCHDVTYAIRDSAMTVDEKSRLISLMFRQLPEEKKRSAAQALAQVDKALTAQLVMPLIKNFPRDVDEPYRGSEAAALTHVIMYLDDTQVWSEYLQKTKQAAVGLRMEMMNPMNYSNIAKTNIEFRLAFLSSFLDDETIRRRDADRRKFAGPCAAFTFEEISVRDFVTMKLAALVLEIDEYPDDSWTPEQWEGLRKEVRSQLATRNLPDISMADK